MHETQPCETDPRFLEIDSNLENRFLDDNGGGLPPLSVQFPYAVDSDVAAWKLYNRPEILWRSSCQFEGSDLADAQSSVDEITRATLALMVISIFATIFDLTTTVWVVKTQLDDDPTNDHSAEGWQKLGKTSCITANIITTIVILVVAISSQSFFSSIADDCTDPETDQTLDFLAREVDEIARLWYGKIALDAILFIYSVYYAYRHREEMKNLLPCGCCCYCWRR
mmetsp:Transcript_13969/g.19402  ORF Transcript_13969/g.19402 Transcript_13969/m.19402 type:complete len:225 (+) Transcript_13969:803-1477(+)